jgi:hypothetical protein
MPEPPTADKYASGQIRPEYGARTVMFGDGDRGSAMQIAAVTFKGKDTGIMIEWRRAHRHDPGKTQVTYQNTVYPDVKAATVAYEKDHPIAETD